MSTSPLAVRRRMFILSLAAVLVPGRASVVAAPVAAQPVFDLALAGGFYHGLGAVVGRLRQGERLALRREPENPYDRFAVAIERDGVRLGYVPRVASEAVSRALAEGRRLAVEIVGRLGDRSAGDEGLVFTGYVHGDPRLRLLDETGSPVPSELRAAGAAALAA